MVHQSRSNTRQRRRRLNSIAALADKPEETFVLRIVANNWRTVRRKGSKAAPGAFNPRDIDAAGLLEAIDALSYGQVVGIGVMRIDRSGVGGGNDDLAALRLGVPGFASISDHGPVL